MDDKTQKLRLKREVGLMGAVSLIGGTIIGSGIFMSPQTVLCTIGSPGASLVVWACCGLLAILASFCYAELGTVIRESGGDYIYILRTSGPVVAFMLIFSSVFFMKPAALAGMALGFAQYVVAPFYSDCPPPVLLVKCVAAAAITLLAMVNCTNVRLSMSVQVFFMAAKVLSLAVIIVGGVVMLIRGHTENFEDSFENTNVGINPIGIAFYQGLWSYDGWNNLNFVTEELKRPEVNLPRALIIAISLVTGIYVLVNVSYLTVMTPKELMSSSAVAVTWGNKMFGNWGWIMSVAAGLSAFGSLNGSFFSGGRMCFVAAREGHMPDILAMVHIHRLTPAPALIFITVGSLLVLIPGDFQSIVNFFSFTTWFFYAITLSGLIYLKIRKPHLPRPYKVPIILPILVLIAAIFLLLAPIIDDPRIEFLYVTLFILSGAIIYIPLFHYKLCPGLLTKLTVFLQANLPENRQSAFMDDKTQKLRLKREVGLMGAVSLIGGTIIGSGIFMTPQTVLCSIGSPGASLVVWACCGLLAILASLCYAELGTVIRESGGDYIYILRTSGPVVAFMFIFGNVLFVRPAALVVMALGFAQYVVAPFYSDCPPPVLLVKCVAAAAITLLAMVNCTNVRLSMSVQVFFMAAKVLSLAVIIVGGVVMLIRGHTENFEDSFENTNVGINPIGIAFYQGLWSYDGWNNLNYVTEELKHPEVNLPRALIIAICLVTGLYVLVNVSYLTVMTPIELMSSSAVAVTWGNKMFGNRGWIMSVAAALSTFGSLNGSFFCSGRICFVAAREGHMPNILSMVQVHRLTPSPALIFITVVSLLVLIPGDFQSIINFFSFATWLFYAITLSGLIYLKIRKPHLPRPYKVPIILPILVLIAAIFLLLAPIIDDPRIEFLYMTLFILSGAIIYIPLIHYKLCPRLLTKLTVFLQVLLQVAPVEKNL